MSKDDEHQLYWDLDFPTDATLKAKELVGLDGLSDQELIEWMHDWALDEALQGHGICLRNTDEALAWVKAKIKENPSEDDDQA